MKKKGKNKIKLGALASQIQKIAGWKFLWISLLVLVSDWASKTFSLIHLQPYQPVKILPFLNFTLAFNTGAAFSFLDNQTLWPNIIFSFICMVVSILILIWLYKERDRVLSVGLALILGGALGNLWDRVHYARVVDFIDLHIASWHWPVFNVADSGITIGALLILLRLFIHAQKK